MNFSTRTQWPDTPNPLAQKLSELRKAGTPILDLTVSNPTRCGFEYLKPELLKSFLDPHNLIYEPDAHGLRIAREAVADYYRKKGIC